MPLNTTQKLASLLTEACQSPTHYSDHQKALFNLGTASALLFFDFIRFIIDSAEQLNARTVYYVTREGEFFQTIHQRCTADGGFASSPNHRLLELSRLTTFLPSLRSVSVDEMKRLWRAYPSQSIRAMLESLNIFDTDDFAEELKGFDLESEVERPWTNADIQRLFETPEFRDKLTEIIEVKRTLLLQYLESRCIKHRKPDPVFIVDIGWRGSTQDNLAWLYPNKHFHAFYFGTQNFFNPQPPNISKRSFLRDRLHMNNHDQQLIMRFLSPIEMLCNSPNGSAVDYKYLTDRVCAVRRVIPGENEVYEKYTRYFQSGVLSAVPHLLEIEKRDPGLLSQRGSICRDIAHALWLNPPKNIAEAFFELQHDEQFGMGKIVDKGRFKNIPHDLLAHAIFSKRKRRQLGHLLESSGWAQGLLSLNNLRILNRIYNSRTR